MTPFFKIAQQGRVLIATLNQPPAANPTEPLVDALASLIDRADQDPSVGAVVLTDGSPASPASRGDSLMAALESMPGNGAIQAHKPTSASPWCNQRRFHEAMARIGRSGSAFIAAIHGDTTGNHLEMALACDMRFLSSEGRVAQAEMLPGHPWGAGGSQRLPRLIGVARALEMALGGRVIEADEALRIGLVSRVIPPGQLLAEAVASASVLARRSKAVVAATKQAVLEGGPRALAACAATPVSSLPLTFTDLVSD